MEDKYGKKKMFTIASFWIANSISITFTWYITFSTVTFFANWDEDTCLLNFDVFAELYAV